MIVMNLKLLDINSFDEEDEHTSSGIESVREEL